MVKHPMVAAAEELQTILTSMESKALDVVAFTALTDAIVKACIGSVENRSAFGDTGGLETFGHIAFIILSVDSAYPALAPLFDAVRCLCTKHGRCRCCWLHQVFLSSRSFLLLLSYVCLQMQIGSVSLRNCSLRC